jgi:hypothetical protein
MGQITNLVDVSHNNYSEDWRPPYDKLRAELISTWLLHEKRRKEMRKLPRGGKEKLSAIWVRNLGEKNTEVDTSKLPCHNWSRGNGFCKYAEACRYGNSGPKGGTGKSITLATNIEKREESD